MPPAELGCSSSSTALSTSVLLLSSAQGALPICVQDEGSCIQPLLGIFTPPSFHFHGRL